MKKSITNKIIISYLVMIALTLAFVGVIFNFSARRYMEKQARLNLEKDAKVIAEVFKNNYNSETDTMETRIAQLVRQRIRRGVGHPDSFYAITTKDGKILYPKAVTEETTFLKQQILPELKNKLKGLFNSDTKINSRIQVKGTEYMVALIPEIFTPKKDGNPADIKLWVILYTPVGQVQALTDGMIVVLLLSIIFTGILGVILGVFIAKSIAKPIILLKNRAEKLSERDFDSRVEIKTGDELEELAVTVEKMATELKEYDIAQKRFLQNASHELKTPLMSIQGYAEGIKDGVFEDNGKALDIIIDESTRLKRIVEETIFLSKLETMEGFYRFTIESVNEIVEKSIEKVESLAQKNGIRMRLFRNNDAMIKMDSDKFTQALINIFGNSLRYARSEIIVTIKNNGGVVEIIINDDGEGFDERDLSNVFERFYKGIKGNTGLGMAITKVIIEKHGGFIEALNGNNGGAEIRIRLSASQFEDEMIS